MEKRVDRKKQQEEKDDEKTRRRIMILIIIIIILLSLITSCSCTSNFFGKIGNWFQNEGDHPIDSETNHQEVIKNRELKFDSDNFHISLSDSKAKLSYTYRKINPKKLSCTTSDAKIATCYVQDGYVVINPKQTGKVTVTLQTSVNGKTYEATTIVTITDPTKYIQLDSTSGTINLAYQKELKVPYSLVGLTGKVKVTSSDEKIAKAIVKDGVLVITANKTGKVDITLSVTYNGVEYKVVYQLTVINDKNNTTGNQGSKDPSKPTPGETKPSEEKKENNSKLRELNLSWIDLGFKPDKYEYRIGVSSWRKSVKLTATPQSRKAKIISYTFNGKEVSKEEIQKLKLRTGENTITITVQAEDGTTSTYKVVIDKAKSSNNYLKNLTTSKGSLTPTFDKNKLDYSIEVGANTGAITLTPTPRSKKATLTYTYNGVTTTSLENLNLRTGPNVVKIKVTAEDGSSRTYKVTINRATAQGVIDSNSLLKELTDSLGKIDFDPYQTNYTIGVDKNTDEISLTAKPSSKKAKVTYEFNGQTVQDLSHLDLVPGNNTVKIVVTAEDGSKTEYTVIINKETENSSNTLTNVKVIDNKAELEPKFDSNTLNYQINVDSKTSELGLEVTPHSKAKEVLYTYNGKTITKEELKNLKLEYGDNEVVVTVIGSDDTTRDYTFTIHRKSDKSDDTSLKTLTVDGKSILDTYMATVDVTTGSVILKAVPNDKNATLSYIYDGVEYKDLEELQVNLKPGVNTVEIKVVAEDGFTTQIYEVTLVQAERRVRFTVVPSQCYVDEECFVKYVVEDIDSKTGKVLNTVTEDVQDILEVNVTPNNFTASSLVAGKIRVTGDNTVMPGDVATLTVGVSGFHNSNATVAIPFVARDYRITSLQYEYNMSYNNQNGGKRAVVLNTDLFKGNVSVSETTSTIKICSENRKDNCITIEAEGPVEIHYTGETTGPTSLPIEVKATAPGTATLHVTGTAFGKDLFLPSEAVDSKIKINIIRSYLVTVKAYDGSYDTVDKKYTGLFNTLTKEYEFVLEENDSIDLGKYDEPYLEVEEECMYHPFKGYMIENDPDKTIVYDRTTNHLIHYSDLTDDLTLVAVYDMEKKEKLERIDKIMWLSDVPLFYNKESEQKYNKPKMIYPRSHGEYTMNITNETEDTIVISGMILQENTVCIEGQGCLNMGYIIKDHANNYHFGGSDDYWILNTYGVEEATEVYKHDFDFAEETNQNLTLNKGEEAKITIHWKWVDYEDGHTDRLDTLIGNKASDLGDTDLLYQLAVGIKYTTINKKCD